MDASVIVCTYNRSASMKRTLESLAAMAVSPAVAWECIVVDNNSGDDTKSVFEDFKRTTGMNARYLFERRQGKSFALNTGAEAAAGDVLVFTDDDVVVHERWLDNILKTFSRTGASCIGGKILLLWEKPRPRWMTDKLVGQLGHLDLGEESIRLEKPDLYGANFAVRSSVARKYGYFDTTIGPVAGKMYNAEDTQFIKTLIDSGEPVYYVPDVVVHHCIPAQNIRKGYFLKRMYDQAEMRGILVADYGARNICGIPLYIFKEVGINVVKYVGMLIVNPKDAMNKKVELSAYMGFISGRLKWHHSGGLRNNP